MTQSQVEIHGYCDPRFEEVRTEFVRNFAERREIGAAVAIYSHGKLAVNLWGGVADKDSGRGWNEDTLVLVFSATKGLASLCMHILVERGLIDIDAPVARYWPEFAANGKDSITIGTVLAHQAGLPIWQQPVPEGGFKDWDLMTSLIATETPIWEPGTQHGYHAVSLGFILGEVLRRTTGKTIGQFLREEVATPLGADVWIGLPEAEHDRVATSYFDEDVNPESGLMKKFMSDPDWIGAKLATNSGNDITPEHINGAARRSAEIPATGGIVSAHGLARSYLPLSLDGSVDGKRLVSQKMLPLMRTTRSASGKDNILQLPTTFTLGFSKTWGARQLGQGEFVILGENAFGAPGMGGSIGFADGDAELSFGYAMNFHGPGVGLNDRGQSLIDAAYRAVGFSSSDPGFWIR